MSAPAKGGAALTGPRPTLWWTESKLSQALARLEQADPDERMDEIAAREFIAEFVSPHAVAERRDEFASFVIEYEAIASAKTAQAEEILRQAAVIRLGIDKMRMHAVKAMQSADVRALAGATYVMKLKDSPGKVDVVDEALIPAEYWRVKTDDDYTRMLRLVTIVDMLVRHSGTEVGLEGEALDAYVDADACAQEARAILEATETDRRAVDKKSIQAEWKANGEFRQEVNATTGEITKLPMVPGAKKVVDTKLVIE